jgi:D-alanyl-D-alanine carboxypeptidase (penicillin-binding protein 5/6)
VRLAAQAPGQRLPIASTTKLMTAYLALHHLPLSRRLVAPPYTPVPGESLLGLEPGERESVRDLLYGLLLPSGNDAAVTLADGVSGSVPAFVAAMNRTATRLGLHDTHYATPVGLDSPRNYSTARDLLRLVTVLRREPIFRRITDTERATLRDGGTVRHIVNLNDLVLEFPWVTGVKTGNTEEAGHVLIASAKRHGISLIAVLLGAPSISTRDSGSLSLLRYGFARYRPRQPIRASRPVATVPVRYARPSLPLVPANDVRVWARNDQRVRVSSKTPRRVTGPIPRGRRLGTATVSVEGGATRRVVLRAGRSVPAPVIERTVAEAIPGRPSRTLVLGLAALALLLGAVITATVMTPVGESLVSAARSRRER